MTLSVVPSRIPASQAQFLDDVGRTLRAWRAAPLLPLTTLALALVIAVRDARGVTTALGGLVALLFLGWSGVQRLWYLRLWTGRTLTLAEAWRANLRCFGRFLCLGLLTGVAFVITVIPLLVPLLRAADVSAEGEITFDDLPLWALAYSVLLGIVGYGLLTFVTPAIVYSSKRVRDAVPIGLRLLRVSWPRTALYVLVPALAASLPGILAGPGPFNSPGLPEVLASALVLALGRGAVSAYYLRTVPGAGPDGDIRLQPEPRDYPPPAWGS